jgi:hypothetical protein
VKRNGLDTCCCEESLAGLKSWCFCNRIQPQDSHWLSLVCGVKCVCASGAEEGEGSQLAAASASARALK